MIPGSSFAIGVPLLVVDKTVPITATPVISAIATQTVQTVDDTCAALRSLTRRLKSVVIATSLFEGQRRLELHRSRTAAAKRAPLCIEWRPARTETPPDDCNGYRTVTSKVMNTFPASGGRRQFTSTSNWSGPANPFAGLYATV